MSRTRASVVVIGLAGFAMAFGVWRWPSQGLALPCAPSAVHLDARGIAHCGAGAPLPVGQALTLGVPLELNRLDAEALALVPGVPAELARRLVEERGRLGGFRSWEDVDRVAGVGNARLRALQQCCRLPSEDGGV